MAKKQLIKISECRILVYLAQVANPMKQLDLISAKLEVDYGYTIRILRGMMLKNWIFKHRLGRRVFYDLSHGAPLEEAKSLLSGEQLKGIELASSQTTLENKDVMGQGSMGSADNAANMIAHGVNLPKSGEAAAKIVADRYKIPWSEWKARVEPTGIGSSYGDATRRLSTAPFPIAERWAQHFPQGEIYSDLNSKARLYSEAKRRGISLDEMWDIADEAGKRSGQRSMYKLPDAVGAEDLMKQSSGGAVLGVDTDVRALHPNAKSTAESLLKYIGKPRTIRSAYPEGIETPLTVLNDWNNLYQDIKVAPQNIKNLEIIQRYK